MKFMTNYTMYVRGDYVRSIVDQLVCNFHRFPGTNSTVAQTHLHGWEVAIASSPAADPRNYNQVIGESKSRSQVLLLSEAKIWETETTKMYDRYQQFQGTDEEFREYHKDIYGFSSATALAPVSAVSLSQS